MIPGGRRISHRLVQTSTRFLKISWKPIQTWCKTRDTSNRQCRLSHYSESRAFSRIEAVAIVQMEDGKLLRREDSCFILKHQISSKGQRKRPGNIKKQFR